MQSPAVLRPNTRVRVPKLCEHQLPARCNETTFISAIATVLTAQGAIDGTLLCKARCGESDIRLDCQAHVWFAIVVVGDGRLGEHS
jgi:hypothetical protein